jgi:pimeloyl-ACP methyl ester carboxylesterase
MTLVRRQFLKFAAGAAVLPAASLGAPERTTGPGRPMIRRATHNYGSCPMDTIKSLDDINQDRNDLPTMIIHGDDDRILPADVTSRRQAKLIKGVKFIEIKGGSHGLPWTHAEEINTEIVRFLT